MKRDYVKFLWSLCGPWSYSSIFGVESILPDGGYILNNKMLNIPDQDWALWEQKKVIHSPFVAQDVDLPAYEELGLAVVFYLPIFEGSFSVLPVKPNSSGRTSTLANLELFKVNRKNFARFLANSWGLKAGGDNVKPDGYLVGNNEYDEPLVFLIRQDKNIVFQASELKENLSAMKLFVIADGNDQVAPTRREQERLYDKGITYLIFDEFLTEEGTPRWFYKVRDEILEMPSGLPISYDEENSKYRCEGKLIRFADVEHDIFTVLIRNANDVVCYDEWSSQGFTKENLKPHVSRLKKKLSKKLRNCIVNIHNQGYSLSSERYSP